jgi:2-methylcitrate dehydratase PrpD
VAEAEETSGCCGSSISVSSVFEAGSAIATVSTVWVGVAAVVATSVALGDGTVADALACLVL